MFDPEDFRKFAAKILQHQCDEAGCRTAISRCYYAAFLFARNLLDPHFHFSKEGKGHVELRMLFLNATSPESPQIASKLDDLRKKRNDADYDLDDTDVHSQLTARRYEAIAATTIKQIRELLTGPNANTVLAAMKKWGQMSSSPRPK